MRPEQIGHAETAPERNETRTITKRSMLLAEESNPLRTRDHTESAASLCDRGWA